ncbi:TPA: conjugal transfer protein TraG, partial [Escherichia coli]|nr:conjugal transfer protein TraG [Escherichia coli]
QATIEQRTQDSGIQNNVKDQVDNMLTTSRENIADTKGGIRDEEGSINKQYSDLQKHHNSEQSSQMNTYNKEKESQERVPGADSPEELMKKAKKYQDKHKQ